MVIKIKKEVKSGRYATTSEFFRFLIRKWEEDYLLAELQINREDIKKGRGKILKSLADLR